MRTALFALCGSGTTGCHDGFHGGAWLRARWEWDTDEAAREWWDGGLAAEVGPHSPELFRYGRWVIEDADRGFRRSVRGDGVALTVPWSVFAGLDPAPGVHGGMEL